MNVSHQQLNLKITKKNVSRGQHSPWPARTRLFLESTQLAWHGKLLGIGNSKVTAEHSACALMAAPHTLYQCRDRMG